MMKMENRKPTPARSPITDRGNLLRGVDTGQRTLLLTFGISLVCHAIFFGILVFMPKHSPAKKFAPTAINVSMVKAADILPAAVEPPGRASKPEITPPPPAKAKPEVQIPKKLPKVNPKPKKMPKIAQAKPPEAVSIPKKLPKVKPKPKKKPKIADAPPKKKPAKPPPPVEPSNSVKNAIEKLEKSIAETKPDPVKSALAKIKRQVAASERQGSGSGANPGAFDQNGSGDYNNPRIQLYGQEMKYHIKRYWAFSRQLAGLHDNLETHLLIEIGRDGRIIHIDFKKKSGNHYLDESAFKAVKKSNPLPRLPGEYRTLAFVVRFTPSGLN